MKKRDSFIKRVPGWLWVLIVLVFLVLCCLPYLFTQSGWIDFTQTGQIGDTIGGTMGPFVAIIAALLTFIAFWVQYEANINQREDISIERQEAKFYKMLDIYSSITNGLEVHGIKGKKAFAELVGEFTYTFFTIYEIYKQELNNPLFLRRTSPQIRSIIDEFNQNKENKLSYLTQLSYNLFFYGKNYVIVDIAHPEKTALGEEIKKSVFRQNKTSGKTTFSDYVKTGRFDITIPNSGLAYPLFEGHSDFLGHYFRHLYQMVKYVALLDDNLFDETTKAGYVKILRSQMSDYEQILLYYNSLTEQGSAWNTSHGTRFPEEAGYIARFRLIKNIPPNFPMFGILPFSLYREDAEKWKKLGKLFYEHTHLPISNSSSI